VLDRLRRLLRAGPTPILPTPLPRDPRRELAELVADLVRPGFRTRDEVREIALDRAADDVPGLSAAEITAAVDAAWAARLAEQRDWPARTDADRLDDAFAALERTGVVARASFTCCTTCGFAEIGDEVPADQHRDGFVFFHSQDAEGLDEPGTPLALAFGGFSTGDAAARTEADRVVGERVRAALLEHGLPVEWDGDPAGRIVVRAPDWRRRLPA
jgi:hypothetical protein